MLLAALLSLAVVPRWWCGRDAGKYYDGDEATQQALADHVVAQLQQNKRRMLYQTGSSRFDGQSAIAIYQMTILGLGQIVRRHPHLRETYLPAMRDAADRMVDPRTHPYAAQRYGHHGVHGAGRGHAYLGYINLALGMLRQIDPDTRHAALHDRITRQLARQLAAAPNGMMETYPGETWPPDVAAVAGSVGLHAAVTGTDRSEMLRRWSERFARCAVHSSGYLQQRLNSGSCQPADVPRGSGTAIAAYFISFADPALSRRLYQALREPGAGQLLGFAAIREHPPGVSGGRDLNAGPTPLGFSVGATGFGLGAALAHGDEALFTGLYRSTHLLGIPHDGDGRRAFAAGGLLGNALLLAMLTAQEPA